MNFLDDYLSGALPAPDRMRFEAHLARCLQCIDYLRSYRATVHRVRDHHAALDDEPCADIPEALVAAILASRGKL